MITNHQQRMKHKTVSNSVLFCSVGRKTVLFLLWLNCEPEANIYHSNDETFKFEIIGMQKIYVFMLKYFKDGVPGNVTIIKQEIVTVKKTNNVSNFLSSPYVVTSKTAAVQKTVLNLVLIKHTYVFTPKTLIILSVIFHENKKFHLD